MDDSTNDGRIGAAVRRARRSRGLTLEQLSGLAARSTSWLSKVERGLIPLEKRADIAALAEALGVSADALIGQAAPEVQPGRHSWNLAPLRAALLDFAPDDPPDIRARTLAELRAANDEADRALRWSDYDGLLRDLPGLICELEVHCGGPEGPERDEALRLLILACAGAGIILRYTGHPDLAWVSAERSRQAAAMLGDPVWEGASAFGAAHARPSANRPRALLVSGAAADKMEPLAGTSQMGREVYGMLRLSAALACSVQGDHAGAAEQGAEAARVASGMEDRADAFELFGPANCGVWLTSLQVEAGNAEKALAHAATVNPGMLASNNRRGALKVEKARAHAMLNQPQLAIAELRAAERLSSAQVLGAPLVRELVGFMLVKARREAGGRELRGLAWRMGIL
jgi:transcriptional regulator with XRE-family HTH domain